MQSLDKLTKSKLSEQAKIKRLVAEAGLTFALIDRKFGLRAGAARDALREPSQPAERAIAAALKMRPHNLWLTRYHASGRRRQQQDYSRPPTLAQRRKFAEAQT